MVPGTIIAQIIQLLPFSREGAERSDGGRVELIALSRTPKLSKTPKAFRLKLAAYRKQRKY